MCDLDCFLVLSLYDKVEGLTFNNRDRKTLVFLKFCTMDNSQNRTYHRTESIDMAYKRTYVRQSIFEISLLLNLRINIRIYRYTYIYLGT